MKEKIVYKNIEEIIPYNKNPRNNEKAIDKVAKSIEHFGFKNPVILDKNNVIVCGHTRTLASIKLGLKEIPCIIADDLTDEQIKAFRLVDNRTNEYAEWDYKLLNDELESILNIDMSQFDFRIDLDDDIFKENQRQRTNDYYNLDLVNLTSSTNDFWQMPVIENDNYIPKDIIGFNYAKSSKEKNVGIHFYLDDYQFERLWNNPDEYIDVLSQYDCIFSPDYSLYLDMPMPMKIWNVYRSRQIGQYYQSMGMKVIPTISWAEKETFDFCFKGIPKGSIVSVSTIGVKRNSEALQIWKDGMDAMIKEIEPSTIIVYGGKLDYDYGDINVVYFENKVTERMKEI